jgi:hypothetical protein
MIFNTPSVGEYLKISILAYSCQDKDTALGILKGLEAFQPGLRTLREFYASLEQKKELIGYYEHTWYPVEKWGTASGQFSKEGQGDLQLWFRIWSDKEPPVVAKPTFLPDVKIQSVTLPSNVKKRPASEFITVTYYDTTFRLVNNESVNITVHWQAHSSVAGDFAQGDVTVPKNGYFHVTEWYYYKTAGTLTITYTISYKGNKLDSWSGTMVVSQ